MVRFASVAIVALLGFATNSMASFVVAEQNFDTPSTWDAFSVTATEGSASVLNVLGNSSLVIDGNSVVEISLSQSGLDSLSDATLSFDYAAFNADAFDTIRVAVTQDGNVGPTEVLDLSPALQSFAFALDSGVSSVSILIDATNIDELGTNSNLSFDNFVLAAVPEPGSFLFGSLLATGVAGVVLRRRRMKAAD